MTALKKELVTAREEARMAIEECERLKLEARDISSSTNEKDVEVEASIEAVVEAQEEVEAMRVEVRRERSPK